MSVSGASILQFRVLALLVFLSLSPIIAPSYAATDPRATGTSPQAGEAARQQEAVSAYQAAVKGGVNGPASVPLSDQANLRLPADMIWVHSAEAGHLLRALGNQPGDVTGMVISSDHHLNWFVVVRYIGEGYIKDDDAKNWNSDDLLAKLRDGTDISNKDRAARGFEELEIVGWVEKPTYDADTHRLVWSIRNKLKGQATDIGNVNYNTYALGRKGYFSLNLVTTPERVESDKAIAKTLLGGLDYTPGNRYEDFIESTDKVAAYGLAGLLGIVAAKKLGMLALAGAFILKFAKLGLVAVAGIGVAIKRFFRRKPGPEAE